ncbi:hypothetical protein PWT90_06460 [Aphanocladium album]|nr:hypothetical protein PWT90_06460 [Aphanocladium album]
MAFILNGISSFLLGGNRRVVDTSTGVQLVVEEAEPTTAAEAVAQQDVAPATQPEARVPRQASQNQPMQNSLLDSSSQSSGQPRDLPPPYRSRDENSQLPEDEVMTDAPSNLDPFEQRIRLLMMHISSLPEYRWDENVATEKTRLIEKWTACNLRSEFWLEAEELTELAKTIVQHRWEEQGLRRDSLSSSGFDNQTPWGFWQHQVIREDHRPQEVRELDSSRPFFQFMHEVAAERDHLEFLADPPRLPSGLTTREVDPSPEALPDDLHTTAYHNVRYDQWEPQGIWDYSWGAMPGMFWKHERHIREVFMEEFGSVEGIGPRCMEISDALPDKSSFRRRRIATEVYFSMPIQNVLRKERSNGAAQYLAGSNSVSGRPDSLLFRSPAPENQGVSGPSRNSTESLLTRGLSSGARDVRQEGQSSSGIFGVRTGANAGQVSGQTTESRGLFGGSVAAHERVVAASSIPDTFSARADPDPPVENQPPFGAFPQPQGLGLFGVPLTANTSRLSPDPDSDHSPQGDARVPLYHTGRPMGLQPILEVSESDESEESVYGDENADAPLHAMQAQLDAAQRSIQQVLGVHKALAAQLAKFSRGSAGRQSHRAPFTGESHQRRVLGPLPSLQRVSKKGKGQTRMGSPGSSTSSSLASTVIRGPVRSPSPTVADLVSAEPVRGLTAVATDSFTIREDDDVREQAAELEREKERERQAAEVQETEHTETEEPGVALSPRARARQRRRGTVERPNLPVRRSTRRAATRR